MAEMTIVDPDTGELRQPGCQACTDHVAKIAGLLSDLENVQGENTKLLRKIKAIERDRDKERQGDPQRAVIQGIFDYWREQCNHPNARLDGARFDLIKKALRMFTVEELRMAIDGAAVAAYVDPSGKKHDRLGLILKDAERIEDFSNRYAKWKNAQRKHR